MRAERIAPVLLALCVHPGAVSADDEAAAWLRRAFANRYEVDTSFRIELVVRNAAGESLERRLVVATKTIGGRLHSLGRFTDPEHLRGTTVLNIERADRGEDHFLYLRSLGRIRRIATSQRADSPGIPTTHTGVPPSSMSIGSASGTRPAPRM